MTAASGIRYTDLSISIRAAWHRQHILNGGSHIKTVPAWLCRVTRNEGYDDVLNERELTISQVEEIASLIDSFQLEGNPNSKVKTAVSAAQRDLRADLNRQLVNAERVAGSIPEIRAALGMDVS